MPNAKRLDLFTSVAALRRGWTGIGITDRRRYVLPEDFSPEEADEGGMWYRDLYRRNSVMMLPTDLGQFEVYMDAERYKNGEEVIPRL